MGATRARVLTFMIVGLVAACGAGSALANRAVDLVDGTSVARDIAQKQAERLNGRLGYRNRPRDAESIAAIEVNANADSTPEGTKVSALAWSGRVYASEEATIDVRFVVPESQSPTFGGGHGSATRCYRYTLQYYRYTRYREIRCPAIADPPTPSASPVLRLPPDAADRLAVALGAATPQTLANVVRTAFPQGGFTIDTVTAGSTFVAAVGVPSERDCIVMIRTPDGATKQVGFDPIQLEPGETGCGTALYTHPAR